MSLQFALSNQGSELRKNEEGAAKRSFKQDLIYEIEDKMLLQEASAI